MMAARPRKFSGGLGFGKQHSPAGRRRDQISSSAVSDQSSSPPQLTAANVVSGLAAIAAAMLTPGAAMALPAGLEVRGGELTISQPDGSSLIINQGSSRAAGDWKSFDINNGEQVEVRQPDTSSLMLGRVTGGTATQILGSLSADGGVILINPNGMLIGPSAVINTASFTASTSDVNPEVFMAGGPIQLQRSPLSPADARIINQGTISVSDTGMVALLAPQIQNDGVIHARLGQVQLAAGTQATLDLSLIHI